MKNKPRIILSILISIFYFWISGNAQVNIISKDLLNIELSNDEFHNTDTKRLKFDNDTIRQEKLRHRVESCAQRLNLKPYYYNGNRSIEIRDVLSNGCPLFYGSYNAKSSSIVRTNLMHKENSSGLILTGKGRNIGIWEVGKPLLTHNEFGGRVTILDNNTKPLDNHASHVAGTLAAKGNNLSAKGMSFEANLRSFDSVNDLNEMRQQAQGGMRVSNHSYGSIAGWTYDFNPQYPGWAWFGDLNVSTKEDWKFGIYSAEEREIDDIVYDFPFYLPVRAASNDRDEIGPNPGEEYWVFNGTTFVKSTTPRNPDGNEFGYESLPATSCSKNTLVVGAVDGLFEDMSSFSSWGPTDDGRIKPDIVAPGVNVLSCGVNSNSHYFETSGTSMASPVVAGSINLIHEFFGTKYNQGIRASGMKALLIQTTQSFDAFPLPFEGPNYQSGWGMLDTKAAIDQLDKSMDTYSSERFVSRDSLSTNTPIRDRRIYLDGSQPFKATIAWTDVSGVATPNFTLNNKTSKLVNDLDLRLIRESDNKEFFPWILDPNNPSLPATTGDNKLDNVEQIYLPNPKQGIYKLQVKHKGSLNSGKQYFSIIYSGRTNLFTAAQDTFYSNSSNVIEALNPFSDDYLNNTRHTYTILAPNNNPVKLYFVDFIGLDLEDGKDYIKIYNGTSAIDPLIASLTGKVNLLEYTASSGKMYIEFSSDSKNARNAWSAYYTTDAASFLTLDKKELFSSSIPFTQTVSIQTNCDWEIKNIPNWITVSKISGSSSASVNISWTQNNTPSTRIAILEIHGCNGLKETITVTQYGCTPPVVPTITATKLSICIGETATLTVTNPCIDCQYLWSNNSTGTSITVNQGAKYRVTASNTCTNVQSSEVEITTKSLPIKPVTSLEGTIKICDESSKTISVINVCNGCTIKWSTGETTSSINVNATGTYNVAFVNDCGEGQKSDNIIVEKETYIPTIVVNDLCYLAGPNGGLSYQWQLNGLDITGANLQFYVAKQNGYYTLKAVRSDNCSGISEPKFISGCVSSTNQIEKNNIIISPNPFLDNFTIFMPLGYDQTSKSWLYTIDGIFISTETSKDGVFQFQTQNLLSGCYILKIQTDNKIVLKRIIKI